MIEIFSKGDVEKISDPGLTVAVLREFDRLSNDYEYLNYGYFIVVEFGSRKDSSGNEYDSVRINEI